MTSNAGSTFYNLNQSKSFAQSLSSNLVALSAFVCSEVLIINKTGQDVYLYDNQIAVDSNRLLISTGESIILRGVTNSASVSAKTLSGGGTLYYRPSYFSNYNQG